MTPHIQPNKKLTLVNTTKDPTNPLLKKAQNIGLWRILNI